MDVEGSGGSGAGGGVGVVSFSLPFALSLARLCGIVQARVVARKMLDAGASSAARTGTFGGAGGSLGAGGAAGGGSAAATAGLRVVLLDAARLLKLPPAALAGAYAHLGSEEAAVVSAAADLKALGEKLEEINMVAKLHLVLV